MKRIYIETYGCQMNVADSELMFGVLGREGYVRADDPAEADVMLVNTCAVRDNAEQRVIGRMGELQRHKRPGDVLGVVGCMAQRLGPALLERVPKVDLVVGPDAYRNLPELIGLAAPGPADHRRRVPRLGALRGRPAGAGTGPDGVRHGTARLRLPVHLLHRPVHARAGAEPPARGRRPRGRRHWPRAAPPRSRCWGRPSTAITTARTTSRICCARWARWAGIRRLRFTSPYPTDFTDRVIEAMASTPAVCEHVHLPVQSGSDAVLRRMLRRYTRARYLEVVASLRSAIPGITFSTDIIVGFPGETEEQFEETLTLVTDADFDDAYTFKYSVREGTPAVRLRDHVPDEVASARLERLIEAVRANARRKNVARVGEVHEVLVERPARRGGLMLGRTRTNQLVLLDLPLSAAGEYHTCRLTGTTGSTFTGAVVMPALAVL